MCPRAGSEGRGAKRSTHSLATNQFVILVFIFGFVWGCAAHGGPIIKKTAASVCEINAHRHPEFIRLGTMDVTKPYDWLRFGDIHGPKL